MPVATTNEIMTQNFIAEQEANGVYKGDTTPRAIKR